MKNKSAIHLDTRRELFLDRNLVESQASRAREMRKALVALIRKEGAPWYLQGDDLRAIPYDPRHNYYTGQRLPLPQGRQPREAP